jgi:hypothetical protein
MINDILNQKKRPLTEREGRGVAAMVARAVVGARGGGGPGGYWPEDVAGTRGGEKIARVTAPPTSHPSKPPFMKIRDASRALSAVPSLFPSAAAHGDSRTMDRPSLFSETRPRNLPARLFPRARVRGSPLGADDVAATLPDDIPARILPVGRLALFSSILLDKGASYLNVGRHLCSSVPL